MDAAITGGETADIVLSTSTGYGGSAKTGLKIGSEWIGFTSTTDVSSGKKKLNGVKRGLFGSTPADHAGGSTIEIPAQYLNVTRGQLGSEAKGIPSESEIDYPGILKGLTHSAAHSKGTTFKIFENVDDAVRQTCAHEAAHVTGVTNHTSGADGGIMKYINGAGLLRGAYVGGSGFPIGTDYTADSKGNINAR